MPSRPSIVEAKLFLDNVLITCKKIENFDESFIQLSLLIREFLNSVVNFTNFRWNCYLVLIREAFQVDGTN